MPAIPRSDWGMLWNHNKSMPEPAFVRNLHEQQRGRVAN